MYPIPNGFRDRAISQTWNFSYLRSDEIYIIIFNGYLNYSYIVRSPRQVIPLKLIPWLCFVYSEYYLILWPLVYRLQALSAMLLCHGVTQRDIMAQMSWKLCNWEIVVVYAFQHNGKLQLLVKVLPMDPSCQDANISVQVKTAWALYCV
jgi:hypothetical protein